MFIDELKIYAKAGNGGDGVVRWLHLKGKEFSGPSGGNGGNGADVSARAVRNLSILQNYLRKKEFYAENGEAGMKNSKYGKNGEPFFIDVPVGSVIENLATGETIQLIKEGEEKLILKGGRGGLGNESFKSSRNTTPQECTLGTKGEEGEFFIELEIIADAGFIGFPNAGKSTLLNELTRARAKVKSYPFTTLEPNLGDFYGYILADIPGLIEGAAQGKGLGYKFLRHIKRTRMLIHCISLDFDSDFLTDAGRPSEADLSDAKRLAEILTEKYKIIREELKQYDKDLLKKPEIIILTKSDLIDAKTVLKIINKMKKINSEILTLSAYDDDSIKNFSDFLIKKLRQKIKKVGYEKSAIA
ncbi:MAG: GTPase ObgE [Patescibacteria group bacterium]